jgi:hypothetical protein
LLTEKSRRSTPGVHATIIDVPAVRAFGIAAAGEGGHGAHQSGLSAARKNGK